MSIVARGVDCSEKAYGVNASMLTWGWLGLEDMGLCLSYPRQSRSALPAAGTSFGSSGAWFVPPDRHRLKAGQAHCQQANRHVCYLPDDSWMPDNPWRTLLMPQEQSLTRQPNHQCNVIMEKSVTMEKLALE